jgi:hypothetical protein
MAIVGTTVSVGTTALQLVPLVAANTTNGAVSPAGNRVPTDPFPCVIINESSSVTLYLGGSAVTSSSTNVGFPLAPNTSLSIDVIMGDTLWGVAASTITVGILIGRQ